MGKRKRTIARIQVMSTRHRAWLDRGKAFIASTEKVTMGGGGGADFMYLKAPAGARLFMTRIVFAFNAGSGTLYVSANPTGTITGSSITPRNRKIGDAGTSGATLYKSVGGVASKGNILHAIPFAISGGAIIDLPIEDEFILDADQALLISFDADATAKDAACSLEWAEE
jgi:hypothetical protein